MNAQKSKGKIGLLSRFLVGSLPYFILSILMTGLSALCDMISPQIIRVTVDHILGNSAEEPGRVAAALIRRFGGAVYLRAHLYIPALLLLLVAVFKVLGQYFFRITNAKAGQTLVKNMRDMLFSHIERLPFSFHMKHQTGDLIQRCTSDIDETQRFVTEQMTGIFRIVILLTLSVVFMSGMSLPMTLIALSPTPLIMFTVKQMQTPYGLAVTASHNPAIYNGIKVFTAGGRDADQVVTGKIEAQIALLKPEDVKSIDYDQAMDDLAENIKPQSD